MKKMINGVELFAVVFVSVFLLGAMSVMFADEPRHVKYDCRYAEISPDFPPQAREICRRRR